MSKLIGQIDEQKQRRNLSRYDPLMAGAAEVLQQLDRLLGEMARQSDEPSENWKLYPIGMVTCLENITKWAIKTLVDHGEPYSSNARRISRKISIEDLMFMIGKKISGGEVVAHLISVNNAEDIGTELGQILSRENGNSINFWDVIKGARVFDAKVSDDTAEHEFPKILDDGETVHRAVKSVFRLRHIVVHEIYDTSQLKTDLIKNSGPYIRAFIVALIDFMLEEIMPGHTASCQFASTAASTKLWEEIHSQLEEAEIALRALVAGSNLPKLDTCLQKWTEYIEAESDFFDNPFGTGTGAQMCFNGFDTALMKSRLELVRYHIDNLRVWNEQSLWDAEFEELEQE